MVVGPLELVHLLPEGVCLTTEEPPGGGPVAGIAAGLSLVAGDALPAHVAVLASDLPFLTAAALRVLWEAAADDGLDGAVLVDGSGRPQWLAGIWRIDALTAHMPPDPAGASMRQVLNDLRTIHVAAPSDEPPAWFDCDTEQDIRRAEELLDAE